MATHSSILAWRIPRTEEPGGLLFMWSQESDTTTLTRTVIKAACSWRQNRQKNGARQKARKETPAHTFSDYEKRGKARICNGEKNTVSSISCVGKSEQLHVERVRHYVSVLSCSVASDSVTLWTVARQAPLSVGFSRQENWSGLPCPPPGDLPHPGNIRRYAKINSKWFKDISKT